MIFDQLENADRYASLHPGFAPALAFLRSAEVRILPPGKHEIDGEKLFVVINRAQGLNRAKFKLETHRKYIDIQYSVTGADELGWAAARSLSEPEAPYDSEKDVELFPDQPDAWITMPPGTFAILFPQDAHCAMQGKGELHKAVVKVAVNWDD